MTFVKNADNSITQSGTDDSTLPNSTTFADLVAVSDPISFIETTNVATDTNDNTQSIVCKIPKITVGGTLNITAPRTVSNFYMIVNGGTEFQTNELANFGDMTFQGYVRNNDGLNESAYNLTLELARISDSNFKQGEGAMDLRGTSNFSDMIIRNANPVDAYSDQNGILNLTRVWLQPIDRSFTPSGISNINSYWRYRQTGLFEDVILSSPITFFRVPPAITRPTILSLGGDLFVGFCGVDRSAVNGDPVNINGLDIIGDGSIQSLGSPRIYITNSEQGTDTTITTVGFDIEKQAGVIYEQDVQFRLIDTDGNPLPDGSVIRQYEEEDPLNPAPSSLYYCTDRSTNPDTYTLYDDTWEKRNINNWVVSGGDGYTNTIRVRQGVTWWNYDGNPNYNSNVTTGQRTALKLAEGDVGTFVGIAAGFKIDTFNETLRKKKEKHL